MDIGLVKNFKKLVNENLNELLLSVVEQYSTEINKLQDIILQSTELIKEKELLIKELNNELEDKNFDEDNFKNVSLIQNLTKQVDTLKNENSLLNVSLNSRKEKDKNKYKKFKKEKDLKVQSNENEEDNKNTTIEKQNTTNHDIQEDENHNEEEEDNKNSTTEEYNTCNDYIQEDENHNEQEESNEQKVDNEKQDEKKEENKKCLETNHENEKPNNDIVNEENFDDGMTEDEAEVEEIEYKNKKYYVKDNMIYNIKKNSEMGKEVGKMVDGVVALTKKKKDKKDKKKNKKEN